MSNVKEKAKRVLLVDDTENIRTLLRGLLEDMGYSVLEAQDGEEAMKLVDIGPVDLIMTDLKMPKMDGIELTRAVRKIEPDLPIVVYSAYRFVDTAPVALTAGANEYITKPFLRTKIQQVVSRLLKEKQ